MKIINKNIKKNKYTLNPVETYNIVMNLRKEKGWGVKRIKRYLDEKDINPSKGAIGGWIYKNKKPFVVRIITQIPESSKEFKLKAMNLLKQGLKHREIAKLLGTNHTNIYDWEKEFLQIKNKEVKFMKKCKECGALIKPFYDLCYNCRRIRKSNLRNNGKIPEPIKAKNFVDEMGINGWNIKTITFKYPYLFLRPIAHIVNDTNLYK